MGQRAEFITIVSLDNNPINNVTGARHNNCAVYGLTLTKTINWETMTASNDSCMICLTNDNDVLSLPCHQTHIFHKNCLIEWFTTSKTNRCPLCKKEL